MKKNETKPSSSLQEFLEGEGRPLSKQREREEKRKMMTWPILCGINFKYSYYFYIYTPQ